MCVNIEAQSNTESVSSEANHENVMIGARPLHILFLSNTRSHLGGAERSSVTLFNALGAERIRISWAGIEDCEHVSAHLGDGIGTRFVNLHFEPFTYLIITNSQEQRATWLWVKIIIDYALRMIRPYWRLRQSLKLDPVDIVVTGNSTVMLGAMFSFIHRVPHVWFVKECLDPDISACRMLASWIKKMSSVVIMQTRAVARPFPPDVRILPEGNDIQRIRAGAQLRNRDEVLQEFSFPSDRPLVVQIGQMTNWKGQHVTARAFVRMASVTGKAPFSLLFLGKGGNAHQKLIENVLEEAPCDWRRAVIFTHFDSNDFSYLNAANIVAHPSISDDPFPNALREAMILGKPVVGSRCGGIPEMIEDGQTGLLVEPNNSVDLASALQFLLQSPEECKRLGENAERFARHHFDVNIHKDEFYALFLSLVKQRSQ